jgi:hypothetical protein
MSIDNLSTNCCEIICNYLSYIDVLALSEVYSNFRTFLTPEILSQIATRQINKYLIDNNLPIDYINKLLTTQKHKTILFGSFILRILTNEPKKSKYLNRINLLHYTENEETNEFTYVETIKIPDYNDNYMYRRYDGYCKYGIKQDDTGIEHSTLLYNTSDIIKYIYDVTDLEFRKVIYDGYIFHIHDINAIITKSASISFNRVMWNNRARLFTDKYHYAEIWEQFNIRIRRYHQMGYKITILDEYGSNLKYIVDCLGLIQVTLNSSFTDIKPCHDLDQFSGWKHNNIINNRKIMQDQSHLFGNSNHKYYDLYLYNYSENYDNLYHSKYNNFSVNRPYDSISITYVYKLHKFINKYDIILPGNYHKGHHISSIQNAIVNHYL